MITARLQRSSLVLALSIVLVGLPSLAGEEIAELAKKVQQSLVIVRGAGGAAGSGVIVDGQGHVVTAAHYTHGVLQVEVEIDGARVPNAIDIHRLVGMSRPALPPQPQRRSP